MQDILAPDSPEILRDATSPQFNSLLWLADGDLANLSTLSTPVRTWVERYVMVLLFETTSGGASWQRKLGFQGPESICEWNDVLLVDGVQTQVGVSCGSDDEVTKLVLRKFSFSIGYKLAIIVSP